MLKVVQVIPALVFGGAETSLLDVCSSFKSDKISTTVLSFWAGDDLVEEFKKISVRLICLNCRSRYDKSILIKLVKVLKEINPDVIHSHLPVADIYCRLANFSLRKPLVTTRHSVLYKANIMHRLDRLSAPLSTVFLANSEHTRRYLIDYAYVSQKQIKLIPLGIKPDNFLHPRYSAAEIRTRHDIPASAFVIGHVGSFKVQKGHTYLLKAMAIFLKIIPSGILLLVGDGDLRADIMNEAKSLGIIDNVRFVGTQAEVSSYMQAADICVFPSISESFGISILEAMACLRTVVAFDTDAIGELIVHDETGFLVPTGDIEGLCAMMIKLYKFPRIKNNLARAALERVRNEFDISLTAQRLLALYSRLAPVHVN